MKKTAFLILLGFIQHAGNSQELIKISPDLELLKISNNAYVHVSYNIMPGYGRVSANGLIFTNNNSAILFDTPWTDSLTSVLISYLTDEMKLQINGFIANHWHEDCMGGLNYLKSQNIRSYTNQLTVDIAKRRVCLCLIRDLRIH